MMGINKHAETRLKTLPSPSQEPLRTIQLSKKLFQRYKHKSPNVQRLTSSFEKLRPILTEYMEQHEIHSLQLDLETQDFETIEPIARGEREMWVSLWLQGELSTKQLLKEIKDFQKYHVQCVSHGYGFDQFLREVEAWLKEKED